MKTIFIIILLLTSSESFGQWKSIAFDSPAAFGVHDTSLFASQKGGNVYRYAPTTPDKWVVADNGINPANTVGAFDSIGLYLIVDAGYRSTDDGSHWTPMNHAKFIPSCFANMNNFVFSGGIAGSGVWRSTDSGLDWVSAYAGLTNLNVGCLAVMGETLFAGTTGGVFLSTDSGKNWTPTGFTSGSELVVIGSILFAGSNNGVYRSLDNGAHWATVNTGLLNPNVYCLVTDGKNLFAGTGVSTSNGTIVEGSGVFLSTDSGATWDTVNAGLPTGTLGFLNISTLCIFDTFLVAGADDGSSDPGMSFIRPISDMVKKDTTESVVEQIAAPSDSIEVYPNPAAGIVTIFSGGTSILGVSVLNVLGEAVLDMPNLRESDVTLDISQLASGTYFLRIETANGSVLRKIIRE